MTFPSSRATSRSPLSRPPIAPSVKANTCSRPQLVWVTLRMKAEPRTSAITIPSRSQRAGPRTRRESERRRPPRARGRAAGIADALRRAVEVEGSLLRLLLRQRGPTAPKEDVPAGRHEASRLVEVHVVRYPDHLGVQPEQVEGVLLPLPGTAAPRRARTRLGNDDAVLPVDTRVDVQ